MEWKNDGEVTAVVVGSPAQQTITRLQDAPGLVIRQVVQMDEVVLNSLLNLPVERKNRYQVYAMPPGKHAKKSQSDRSGWKPTGAEIGAMRMNYFALEESSFAERICLAACGVQNLRNLTMNFRDTETNQIGLAVQKDFACGGILCCPATAYASIANGGQPNRVGRVKEDFACGKNYFKRLLQALCLCNFFYDLEVVNGSDYQKRFQLQVNTCCCGPHMNFCGATIFSNDALFNVYEYDDQGKSANYKKGPVAHLQKTFMPDGADSLFRCCFDFSNYIVEFPEKATAEEKGVLVAAAMTTEFMHYDMKGNN